MDELEKADNSDKPVQKLQTFQDKALTYAPRWVAFASGTALLGSAVYQVITSGADVSTELTVGMAIGLFIYASTGKHNEK
jgi:hypothetical protein